MNRNENSRSAIVLCSSPLERAGESELIGRENGSAGLQYLANFAHLILTLSGRFINLCGDELNNEISAALEAIGNFANVDRSYVFLFSEDGARVTNTHEWCSPGIEPAIAQVQDVPVEIYSWAMPRFKRGEVVHIPNVSLLPRDAEKEQRTMHNQGIQSLINVPLICAGKVLGFVGFDSVRTRKTWRDEHIKLLKVVGEIIAGTIGRERVTARLTRQAQLEKMVAHISTRFINLPTEALDDEIGHAIEEIGVFTGVDRCYLFEFTADRCHMNNTHEWCAAGIESHIDRLQGYAVEDFGYSMARMKRGEVFHVPRVADLPATADREKKEFEQEGIKTLVNVPIMAKGEMIGFLGVDAVHNHLVWSDDDRRLLRLIGEIFANALDRRSTEERLRISLNEKEVLLREIHHRVKNNLQIVQSLLYLQETAMNGQGEPAALDAFRHSQSRIKSMATIHDRLYRSRDLANIDFGDYLRALIPDLVGLLNHSDRISIEIRAHEVRLSIDAAIPCSLIVNELVTNSLEHAFPDERSGKIEIGFFRTGDTRFELSVADNGVGFVPAAVWPNPGTLGLQLVSDLVAQIDGEVSIEADSGTRFLVRFPGI
jgi:two-component sensor histidine kinase